MTCELLYAKCEYRFVGRAFFCDFRHRKEKSYAQKAQSYDGVDFAPRKMDAYFCGTFRLTDRGTQGTRRNKNYPTQPKNVCLFKIAQYL